MLRRNESIENQGYKGYSSYDEYERDYYSAIKLEDTRREIVRIQDELQTASYPRRGLLETKLSTLRWDETYYESKAKEEEYERERRRNFEAQKEASAREIESKREEEAREESAQWERLCTQYPEGSRVVGNVKSRVPGGLMVDVDGVDMFLPGSQIDVSPVRDDASYIGQTFELEVLKHACRSRNSSCRSRNSYIIVSRRTLLEKVMAKERAEVLSRLEKGETNSNGRYKIDLQLSKEEKIYVDGYNILLECYNDELKDGRRLGSRGLILLMAALEKANLEAHIVFDAPVRYFLKENKDEVGLAFMRFLENEKKDMYTIVPADSRADDFILMLADNNKSHIISNDRFKEFVQRYPWVGKKTEEGRRVHRLKIADGWLMLPTIGVSMALHSDVNKVPLEKK